MITVLASLPAAAIALALYVIWRKWGPTSTANFKPSTVWSSSSLEKNPYDAIEPLDDFDWTTTPPIKVWPFKPKYHMTMGMTRGCSRHASDRSDD